MKTVHFYHKDGTGKNEDITFNHVSFIRAGTARQVLEEDDARGNGLPLNAPVIQFIFDDGTTATYSADNVTMIL